MGHEDSGWRPSLGLKAYDGFELWEYEVGPHEINDGDVDGDTRKMAKLQD